MATQKIELGPTGETVRHNIRRLRQMRQFTLDDVASLMSYHGRPMSKATLSQLELGQRRVDVDDLLVLCRVLKVNPNTLLLPPATPDGIDSPNISGFGHRRGTEIREWAAGNAPLDPPDKPQGVSDEDWWTWAVMDLKNASIVPSGTDVPNRKVH